MDDMYNYSADDIGNRTGVCMPGNRYACYAANALNQHTCVTDYSTYPCYDHGPFGEDMAATGPTDELNPFRFSSEVWDGALGLVYYNWRHYNPLDGRFLSRDPYTHTMLFSSLLLSPSSFLLPPFSLLLHVPSIDSILRVFLRSLRRVFMLCYGGLDFGVARVYGHG